MAESTMGIDNAPWWLPHSMVVIKEDYTAADESWVQKRMGKLVMQGSGSKATADVEPGKERGVLQVERMVQPGSVVAVQRRNGRVKTVHLPEEAEQLLYTDLAYIIQQIELANEVMAPEEQADFLPGVNGRSETHLSPVK